jgi:hypothetical protein
MRAEDVRGGGLPLFPDRVPLSCTSDGEVAQDATGPALITNDLLASFRKVDGFAKCLYGHTIAYSYVSHCHVYL